MRIRGYPPVPDPGNARRFGCGRRQNSFGETPIALIVLQQAEEATTEEITDFCCENMAHFKAPRRVEFVTEFPRTATGKLKKFELREPYWAASGGLRVN